MNLHHRFEQIAMQGSKSQQTGFILPALVVISLVLVSMGVVALQYVTASSNSIQSTNFTSVAKNAANAGIQHALSCLDEQSENWTSLTPATDCMGDESIGGASETLSQGGTWRSTYTVSPADERDGQLLVTSTGRVEFFYAGASVASKTFSATSKASVPVSAGGDERPVAEGLAVTKVSAGTGITCAIANMNLYCSGMRLDGRFADGANVNTYYPSPIRINTGGLANKTISDIQTASYNHCAIAEGQSYCWGRNGMSPSGNGGTQAIIGPTVPSNVSPTSTTGFNSTQTRIASPGKSWDNGYQYSCFLNQLRVFCSGGNNVGQLGRPFVTRNCLIGCGAWYIRDDPHHSIGGLFPVNAGVAVPQRVYGYDAAAEVNEYARSELLSQSNLSGTRPTDLQAGAYQACAMFNARIACWGDRWVGVAVDIAGKPADIGNIKSSAGMRGGNSRLVTAMGVGESTSCLVSNGELWCWGFRPGNGTRKATVLGVEHAASPHERWNLSKASNGSGTALHGVNVEGFHSQTDEHMCAYGDGSAYCWGPGVASNNTNTPTRIIAGSTGEANVTDVSAGHNQICVAANGSQYCRGVNTGGVHYGVLGTGGASNHTTSNTTQKSLNIGLTQGEAATKISSGDDHSCAIANNYVYCWGDNTHGQLGDGTNLLRSQPTGINVEGLASFNSRAATQVTAGARHSCAIVSGDVYCWGDNTRGQLGNGSTVSSTTPVRVTMPNSSYKATSIDAGDEHTCAVANGRAYCWGSNSRGQLGISTATTQRTTPVGVTNLSSGNNNIPTHITTGANFSCAIANAYAYCWGDNTHGQVGLAPSPNAVTTPNQVSNGTPAISNLRDEWTALDAGGNFACGAINQVVRCWGSNSNGQLGRNSGSATVANRHVPTTVTSTQSGQNVGWKTTTRLTVGNTHACAIANGEAHCWGDNTQGKLGDNSTAQRNDTRRVIRQAGLLQENNIYAISAGGNHTCGIANGKIMCWGLNTSGQLGNTSTAHSATPTLQGTYLREGRSIDTRGATIY